MKDEWRNPSKTFQNTSKIKENLTNIPITTPEVPFLWLKSQVLSIKAFFPESLASGADNQSNSWMHNNYFHQVIERYKTTDRATDRKNTLSDLKNKKISINERWRTLFGHSRPVTLNIYDKFRNRQVQSDKSHCSMMQRQRQGDTDCLVNSTMIKCLHQSAGDEFLSSLKWKMQLVPRLSRLNTQISQAEN